MNVNDDATPEVSTSTVLLDSLREHAGDDGRVDVQALVLSGVDLRRQRSALEQLCRSRQLLLEFEADHIDRIVLLGPARKKLPAPASQPSS